MLCGRVLWVYPSGADSDGGDRYLGDQDGLPDPAWGHLLAPPGETPDDFLSCRNSCDKKILFDKIVWRQMFIFREKWDSFELLGMSNFPQ